MNFRIELLPAREGDSIWISYGDPLCHMLIDGGRSATSATVKKRLENANDPLELAVVTHVDRDHIEGFLKLLEDAGTEFRCNDLWFNGYDHLEGTQLIIAANYDNPPDDEIFGAKQGEALADAIVENDLPWNKHFEGCAVEVPDVGPGEVITFEGGIGIRLLSPSREKLEALLPDWEKECKKAGLLPGIEAKEEPDVEIMGPIDIDSLAEVPFEEDSSNANGSSIAFLLEYNGKCVLFSGDAHVDRLIAALTPLANGGKVKLDAFKIPHHGSRHNISKELLALIDCDHYLISTNGSYFHHPDPIAISRIIKYGGDNVNLYFNYKSDETLLWNTPNWISEYGYKVHYPPDSDGILLFTP